MTRLAGSRDAREDAEWAIGKATAALAGAQALLGALNLPVDGRMRRTRQLRDLGKAQLTIGIAEQQRKDLALLLGAQDGQEGRRRLSIHYQKNTLQFADSSWGPVL